MIDAAKAAAMFLGVVTLGLVGYLLFIILVWK